MRTATVGGGCRAPRTDPAMARGPAARGRRHLAPLARRKVPNRTGIPARAASARLAPRRAPEVGRRRFAAGRTLTGFEARGCRRQLRGCDGPENLGHSLRLTSPINTWVIPPEKGNQRPVGHFKPALYLKISYTTSTDYERTTTRFTTTHDKRSARNDTRTS